MTGRLIMLITVWARDYSPKGRRRMEELVRRSGQADGGKRGQCACSMLLWHSLALGITVHRLGRKMDQGAGRAACRFASDRMQECLQGHGRARSNPSTETGRRKRCSTRQGCRGGRIWRRPPSWLESGHACRSIRPEARIRPGQSVAAPGGSGQSRRKCAGWDTTLGSGTCKPCR